MITQAHHRFKEDAAGQDVGAASLGRPSSHGLLYCTVTGILSVWVTVALLMVLVPVKVTV